MATEEEREALKPCPFCGASPCAVPQNSRNTLPTDPAKFFQYIWCENCGALGGERLNEERAIAAWNRRVPDPDQSATISRLTAEVGRLREALEPNGDNLAAYIGKFYFNEERVDEDGVPYTRRTTVPLITIRQIMAAILARALANTAEEGR